MKKVLIIGSNGFAGGYLKKELTANAYDVWGADVKSYDERTFAVDMLDAAAAAELIQRIKPACIYNLAGQASPQLSWVHVLRTMHLNVDISVNIVEAVRQYCPLARMIMIGSANQYEMETCAGNSVNEETPQRANSPYAVSKMAQEELMRMMAERYMLDLIITRSFNHIGPGQKLGFVVTDFASRIVAVERGESDVVQVGNLDAWRDIMDVRDTVRAYRLLMEKGRSGEIYNVGSGKSYHIKWILETMLQISTVSPRVEAKGNGTKAAKFTCDCTKLYNDTGFLMQIPIEQSLKDVLLDFRKR